LDRCPPPTNDDLLALLRKYEVIAKLRQDRAEGAEVAPRPLLRALAREFPGALRELDTLPMSEIDTRKEALTLAAQGTPPGPWMAWMIAYHATMRAALVVKARLARFRSPSDDLILRARTDATRASGIQIDDAFVHSVARPPKGRLNVAVFDHLAEKFNVPAAEIWQALFPARRAGRY
jgi:hypothetical protein